METYKDAEYLALHFRSNDNPIVFDPKPQPIASFRAPDSHLRGSIFRREFDRIGNQIRDEVNDRARVTERFAECVMVQRFLITSLGGEPPHLVWNRVRQLSC